MYQSKTGVSWERQLHSWARPDDQWYEGGGSSDTKLGIKKLGTRSMEPCQPGQVPTVDTRHWTGDCPVSTHHR
ncbi:hypothetical protein Vi05172_g3030 [Venturia inaequalis]|nr:hypothetical protein Vi05172_g3030 [Venturia inaequalis]